MAENQQAATPAAAAGGAIRLREYETLFLVKPDVTDEAVDRIKERLRSAVGRDGGKVLKFTHWGKKKTAFPVAKQARAVYVHVNYLGNPGVVAEVERQLAMVEDVSKWMSKHLANEIDPETRQVEADVKLAGDVDERPRPERESGFGGGAGPEAGFGGEGEGGGEKAE